MSVIPKMKITKIGIILAVKNLAFWCASWPIMQIEIEPNRFLWGLVLYAMFNVPSDLYIANHLSSQRELKEAEEPAPSTG